MVGLLAIVFMAGCGEQNITTEKYSALKKKIKAEQETAPAPAAAEEEDDEDQLAAEAARHAGKRDAGKGCPGHRR